MEEGFQKLDLTGKLIIKASVGEDIRRIPIHNDDLTYDELVLMMQRVFRSKISADEELLLKYKDEDGDLVTITDSSDLSFAIQYCRVLKLSVIVGSSPSCTSSLPPAVAKELRNIRDRINHLLDTTTEIAKPDREAVSSSHSQEIDNSNKLLVNGHVITESKEFDPLSSQDTEQQQQNCGKIDSDQLSMSSHSSHQEQNQTASHIPNTATQDSGYAPQETDSNQPGSFPAQQPTQNTPSFSSDATVNYQQPNLTYNPPTQPGYAPATQPSYTPATQSGYTPPSQPGYNPPSQPGYTSSTQPGYNTTAPSQPGYPTSAMPPQPPTNRSLGAGYTPSSGSASSQPPTQPLTTQPSYTPGQQSYQPYPGYNPPIGPPAAPPSSAPAGPPSGVHVGPPGGPPGAAPFPPSQGYQPGANIYSGAFASNPYSRGPPPQGYAHPSQTQAYK